MKNNSKNSYFAELSPSIYSGVETDQKQKDFLVLRGVRVLDGDTLFRGKSNNIIQNFQIIFNADANYVDLYTQRI